MSASARRRANQAHQQAADYPAAVWAALQSDVAPHDDGRLFRALLCDECGCLLLGLCPHPRPDRN